MREVTPNVRLISRPFLDVSAIEEFLLELGGEAWIRRVDKTMNEGLMSDGEALIEFAGRSCYRSYDIGLNPNVTRVRTDSEEYITNLLSSYHGSVTEMGFYVFLFTGVSRVFTHELVRHRAGTAISQESMRYVRLDEIPFWFPQWSKEDGEFMQKARGVLYDLEQFQKWMAEHWALDAVKACPACKEGGQIQVGIDWVRCSTCNGIGKVAAVPFSEKKAKTSFMRRFAPDGVATTMVWGANVRSLRHILHLRTDEGAEEEIRMVFDSLGSLITKEAPMLFSDFERKDNGAWVPQYRKV